MCSLDLNLSMWRPLLAGTAYGSPGSAQNSSACNFKNGGGQSAIGFEAIVSLPTSRPKRRRTCGTEGFVDAWTSGVLPTKESFDVRRRAEEDQHALADAQQVDADLLEVVFGQGGQQISCDRVAGEPGHVLVIPLKEQPTGHVGLGPGALGLEIPWAAMAGGAEDLDALGGARSEEH